MAHRSLREGRFARRTQMGEDVNPSAYIVNLADCMLVLACGFMVALISAWSIDLASLNKIEKEDMTQVDPQTITQEQLEGGSYYVEAGKVYKDPATGTLYMITESE